MYMYRRGILKLFDSRNLLDHAFHLDVSVVAVQIGFYRRQK